MRSSSTHKGIEPQPRGAHNGHAGFHGIFIPVFLNSVQSKNPSCKPLSGELNVQNIPHCPTYPASSAGYITLVPSYSALCRPAFIPALRQSQRFLLWGFGALPGFACVRLVGFRPVSYTHLDVYKRQDLVTQRLVKAALTGAPPPYSAEALADICLLYTSRCV